MNKKLSNRKQFWTKHVKNHQASGKSASEYCRKHGLNPKTFSSQKSTVLKDLAQQKKNTDEDFIPIKKKNYENNVTIKTSSGIEFTFDRPPEPIWIAKVMSQMSSDNDQY